MSNTFQDINYIYNITLQPEITKPRGKLSKYFKDEYDCYYGGAATVSHAKWGMEGTYTTESDFYFCAVGANLKAIIFFSLPENRKRVYTHDVYVYGWNSRGHFTNQLRAPEDIAEKLKQKFYAYISRVLDEYV